MYDDFAIMQEPGATARRWRARFDPIFSPPFKRVDLINATGQKEALGDFAWDRYLHRSNQQYGGHHFEWRPLSSRSGVWRQDDGEATDRRREWRLVVTLVNGAYVHDAYFHAWRVSEWPKPRRGETGRRVSG